MLNLSSFLEVLDVVGGVLGLKLWLACGLVGLGLCGENLARRRDPQRVAHLQGVVVEPE